MITEKRRKILEKNLPEKPHKKVSDIVGISSVNCRRIFFGEWENLKVEEAYTNLAEKTKRKRDRLAQKQQNLSKAS